MKESSDGQRSTVNEIKIDLYTADKNVKTSNCLVLIMDVSVIDFRIDEKL